MGDWFLQDETAAGVDRSDRVASAQFGAGGRGLMGPTDGHAQHPTYSAVGGLSLFHDSDGPHHAGFAARMQ